MEIKDNQLEKSVLISVNLPPETVGRVQSVRKGLGKITGNNLYNGPQNPHITMHINSFYDVNEINQKVGEVVKNYGALDARVEGIHTYSNDVTNGGNTIVYRVEKNKALSDLQKAIVEEVAPHRSPGQERYLRNQGNGYTSEQENNMKKFGYPYGPDNWDFHCSAASVSNEDFPKVQNCLKKYNKPETWRVNSVGVYVQENSGEHKLYQEHKLKE